MTLFRLNPAAEVVIKNMNFSSTLAESVRKCIFKYSKPDTFFETLKWIAYRTWNAVKSIFNRSDWQKTKKILKKSLFTWMLSTLASSAHFKTEKAQILFYDMLSLGASRIANNFLSGCFQVNTSYHQISPEEAQERFKHLALRTQIQEHLSSMQRVIDRARVI